ncbi:M28 family metallopeptidase [Tahibacter amnicola]|uniref:M28 family peptidase n=1 Tax=Tahibacter amnicola TaxID=2976241 RepID=A0ABY6BJE8_9GAMM|nr:M28 family peptidase [Tahibacter amnicola]UXI69975.1 M28 family peptidase [Tahibacter amnicola]
MIAAIPLFIVSAAAAPDAPERAHLTIVDIRRASTAEVDDLRNAPGVRWWLEMGDRLILAGDEAPGVVQRSPYTVLGEVDDVAMEQLALRARGCKEHSDAPGAMLARGGRWELRQLGENEAMPGDTHGEWLAVKPNTVIARQYRPDAKAVMAADPTILPVVNAVSSARWFADVQTLAGWDRSSYGTTSLNAARDWIGTQFTALGLTVTTPSFTMPYNGNTITRHNVIGTWTGTTRPQEWIIVGAHYDSRNSTITSTTNTPGAEDNASGCAGVIELARVLLPHRPQRSILFMCYAGEEQGLYGSEAHVASLQQNGDIAKVKSVVIMDMIGYSADNQLDATFESDAAFSSYLDRFGAAAATYVPSLTVTLSTNPFGSDHMPYLEADKETLLAIETDYGIYPYYHRSTDTPQNMGVNAQAMGSAILKTNAAMLAELTGSTDRLFADGFQ